MYQCGQYEGSTDNTGQIPNQRRRVRSPWVELRGSLSEERRCSRRVHSPVLRVQDYIPYCVFLLYFLGGECRLVSCNFGRSEKMWRKRVGVEPTIRLAKSRIAGFEGREGHRTPFASLGNMSARSIEVRRVRIQSRPPACESTPPPDRRVRRWCRLRSTDG